MNKDYNIGIIEKVLLDQQLHMDFLLHVVTMPILEFLIKIRPDLQTP